MGEAAYGDDLEGCNIRSIRTDIKSFRDALAASRNNPYSMKRLHVAFLSLSLASPTKR